MPHFKLLTVDVGNTSTSFGFFKLKKNNKLASPHHIKTVTTHDIHSPHFSSWIKKNIPQKLEHVVISSVVPAVDSSLLKNLTSWLGVKPYFVTAKSPMKVKVKYKTPSEVGADRIVNARAAMTITNKPAIIIDFGTATTFDCVNEKAEYLGGVIAPGPVISAEALYNKTAKLPLVVLKEPAHIMGRNTLESIQAGLYFGYRGLVKEIVLNLKQKMGQSCMVFSTGGQAKWILNGLNIVNHYYPHLTHSGLYEIWKDLENSTH
ncbi:MAG: type III pantothenate kinase [Elusimicrobiota bacterium]